MSGSSLTRTARFQIDGCSVEPPSLRVVVKGEEVRLEAKVMLVLLYLAEHAGSVVSRAELEERLWPGRIVTEDSVTKAIAKLRRLFGDDARHPRVIETVPKSGYRLIAQVTRIDEAVEEDPRAMIPTTTGALRRWLPKKPWILWTPVSLLVLLGAWGLLEHNRAPTLLSDSLADKPSVAVVPFENLGIAPEEDYFANGITADLITDLSKIKGLLVIAPGALAVYRDSETGPAQISAELGVDYVVVGSVQRLADFLRINVRLVEARVERSVWGERYTGAMSDLFDIQDKLASAVISALKVELAPAEEVHLSSRPTASVVAYDHYLRGLQEHGGRTEAQNRLARGYFERAIELDPTFAQAYAGLALTYSREAIDGWTASPARSLELARQLAGRAAGMDPLLPQVHFVTGQVELFLRRHTSAVESAKRAIEVSPNYADAYALLAWTLSYVGRSDKALSALETAMRLNPRPPASYLEILGEIYFVQGKYKKSASTFQRVLEINPGYLRARMWNAAALTRAGLKDEAEWEIVELLAASPELSLTRLELAFPFKDPRALDRILDALRAAGLPER